MRSARLLILVKELLTESPVLRDNDKKLMWKVWEKEGHVYMDSLSFGSFLSPTRTSEGAIRKARQKIQDDCAELRGDPEIDKKRNKRRKHKRITPQEQIQYRYEGNVAIPVEKDNH